jgi:DNA primase
MFPVYDIKTKIIGFGGRVLDNSKPKYLNSPETPVFFKGTNLYGLNFVIKSGLPEYIIVVEGYMDCISLHQHGVTNTVASLGTALTLEQAKLLKRYCKNIFICYDSDAAGQSATLRGLDILAQVGCEVKIITIPSGKDPDEFIKNFGVDEFKKLIDIALPVSEYRIQMTRNGKNLKDAKQKSIFVNESAKILSSLENEIEIQAYASKISDETGIDIKTILDEIKKIKRTKNPNQNNKTNNRNNNTSGNIYNLEPAYKKAEKWLLQMALTNNDYFKYIKNKIDLDDFITQSLKRAAEFIFKVLDHGEVVVPAELLIKFTEQQDITDISSLFEISEKIDDPIKLIDDCIKTISKYNIENKINELTIKIKNHEEKNEVVESAILSQELIKLQKQLNLL